MSDSKKEKEHHHHKTLVLGYVSFSAPTTGGTIFGPDALIPLNNQVFALNIDVSPLGGLVIRKSGTYGITFNANLADGAQVTPVIFEIFTNARFITSVTVSPGSTLAKVAIITHLEENEVLQVKTVTSVNLYDANLTVALLS
ncbi:hypothetical protein [Gottfriedia acidiceleris]|uniref:hypothetical protein n=1 Tax=Gottfriedia acidiceleris TaxID=371036 RepID=UPI000B435184|nr:hypothetical protein [Gottfriedia acidiceleris]